MSKRKSLPMTLVSLAFILLFAFFQWFPFWLKIVESLQPSGFVAEPGKIYWRLENFNFSNYAEAWLGADMGRGFLNSILYTLVSVTLTCLLIYVVGFVLEKKTFRGRKAVFLLLMSSMMVPGEVLLFSNYKFLVQIGLNNTFFSVIAPGLLNVFGIFVVKQYISTLPDSLLESARIDGAGELRQMFEIMFPMALPAVAGFGIIAAIATWNDYLWPFIVLNDSELYTIQLKLQVFASGTGAAGHTADEKLYAAAGLILVALPVVVVYAVFQRQFMEGMAINGLK